MARTIVIGDIHGCYHELCDLLDRVGPAADDRIIAIGDIVDRGPESEKVLQTFSSTPNACSIMGNHERKHIRAARGQTRAALSQVIVRQQFAERYGHWLTFMQTFPRHLELPEAVLVHGFFEPGVALAEQRDTVVIGTLSGEKYITSQYPPPWYGHYDGTKPLIFGHHDYLRNGQALVREGRIYGIDTGCVYGGRLTCVVLPEFQVVSVPSHCDYWARTRQEYATQASIEGSELDLAWGQLADITSATRLEQLPPDRREWIRRCACLTALSNEFAAQIVAKVQEIANEYMDQLSGLPDWAACSPSVQAARYAQLAKGHPAARLVCSARLRRLDNTNVFRFAATPRALFRLASALGIQNDQAT